MAKRGAESIRCYGHGRAYECYGVIAHEYARLLDFEKERTMITNEGVISRGRGIAADVEESGSLPSPGDNLANATDAVIAAYVTTARRGQGAGVRPFDAAVHAYLVCHPEAHRAAAARIVAEIITHRS